MGAVHSKKRRKEKKKRRQSNLSPYGIQRSVSADVIRSYHVTSSNCCPYCQTDFKLRPTTSTHTTERLASGEFPESTTSMMHAMVRTFSDSPLSRHNIHRHHRCESVHCRGRHEGDSLSDHQESNDEDFQHTYALRPHGGTFELERSTMSLNRDLAGRQFNIVQSRSSDFREVGATFNSRESLRQRNIVSSQRSLFSEHQNAHSVSPDRIPFSGDSSRSSRTQVSSFENNSNSRLLLTSAARETKSGACNLGKHSLMEDEPARLARWEKSKLMAQQLRMLRRHIEAQETRAQTGSPPPTVSPLQSEDTDRQSNQTTTHHPPTIRLLSNESSNFPSRSDVNRDGSDHTSAATSTTTDIDRGDISSLQQRHGRKWSRSKFSRRCNYRYLDNHPIMSKLQNEQNNRLECMERRMREIKQNAMQEAERRRFAEIFPARNNNSEAERLMQEARQTLERLKEDKKRNTNPPDNNERTLGSSLSSSVLNTPQESSHISSSSSEGDIIPVHVLTNDRHSPSDWLHRRDRDHVTSSNLSKRQKHNHVTKIVETSHWLNEMWPYINLDQPLTWLLLPFLVFPLVLRMVLSFIISQSNSSTLTTATGPTTRVSDAYNANVVKANEIKPGSSRTDMRKMKPADNALRIKT